MTTASPYRPSPDNARQRGVRVDRRPYPEGVAGVKLSLEKIAQFIREGRNDPDVRGWAGKVLVAAGNPKSVRADLVALLAAFKSRAIYRPDPVGTEMNVSAAGTLCLRPDLCVPVYDCFPEDTLLLRNDYELIPIKDIRVGDIIWGRDNWTTVRRTVFKGEMALSGVALSNGTVVHLTPDHHLFELECYRHDPSECECRPFERELRRVQVSEIKSGAVLVQPESQLAPQKTKRDGLLRVRVVMTGIGVAPCYDITTSDGFVYLPEHDVTVSNCDDGVVALGSAVLSLGIPVRVIKQTFSADAQEHVLFEAQTEDGSWLPVDPSSDLPVGQKVQASSEFRLDPMNPSTIGLQGAPDGEYVGVGRLPEEIKMKYGLGDILDSNILQQIQDETNAQNAAVDNANNTPIPLSAGQQASMVFYQATGQMNAAGTGPGPGFWLSPVGLIVIGGAAIFVLSELSPLIKAAGSRLEKR